jgi:acyl-CoA thioesterase II
MTTAVQDMLSILDLEQLEVNLFRGRSPQVGWQRVFGGQVIGQALVAATRTVDGRPPHSMHAYFLLAGDPKVPIVYEVDRIRDGKSFTTRRVVAIQHGHAIFSMSVSFHADEEGLDHQVPMPKVPKPEALPSDAEIKERILPAVPESVRRYMSANGRSSCAPWSSAATSATNLRTDGSISGFAPPDDCRTTRPFTAAYWLMPPISRFSIPRWCRMAAASSTAT